MNERIRELAEQAIRIEESDELFPREVFDREKFAELIVEECSNLNFYSTGEVTHDGAEAIGNMILKHFGVE